MNTRAAVAQLSREAEQDVRAAVLACRQMRRASKQEKQVRYETESILHVLHKFYEYGQLNAIRVHFKRCMPVATEHDEETDEESENGVQYYELLLDMQKDDASATGAVPLSGFGLGSTLTREVKAVLDQIDGDERRSASVSLQDNVGVEYDAPQALFKVTVQLKPPQPVRVAVHVKRVPAAQQRQSKRRTTAASAAAAPAPFTQEELTAPSVQECIDFYGSRENTWSLFGFDLKQIFGSGNNNNNNTKHYRKHRVRLAAPY